MEDVELAIEDVGHLVCVRWPVSVSAYDVDLVDSLPDDDFESVSVLGVGRC